MATKRKTTKIAKKKSDIWMATYTSIVGGMAREWTGSYPAPSNEELVCMTAEAVRCAMKAADIAEERMR